MFNKVGIFGTGLIGGSLALALKKKKLAKIVVGTSRKIENIKLAKKLKILDQGDTKISIFKDVDLLILAAPINVILKESKKLAKIISPDCIVIDVGSTKSEIESILSKCFFNFIGCHPIAGSEKKSVKFSDAKLFEKSLCIITTNNLTDQETLKTIILLWKKLGAKISCMDAYEHDRIMAFVSHLPHVVSFALMNSIPNNIIQYCGSGLKDTTRIAASDASIWMDIFDTNKNALLNSLEIFEENIKLLKNCIISGDKKCLEKFLNESKIKREKIE